MRKVPLYSSSGQAALPKAAPAPAVPVPAPAVAAKARAEPARHRRWSHRDALLGLAIDVGLAIALLGVR